MRVEKWPRDEDVQIAIVIRDKTVIDLHPGLQLSIALFLLSLLTFFHNVKKVFRPNLLLFLFLKSS